MRRAALAATAIVLLTVVPVPAAHIYLQEANYVLPANANSLVITVLADGGETVAGVNLYLEIQAGGPKFPVLVPDKPVDLTSAGLIFVGAGQVQLRDPGNSDRAIAVSATTSEPGDNRLATGTLALIKLSTVGVGNGTYSLAFSALGFNSGFTDADGVDVPTTFDSGTLTVVPEPVAWIQLLGLIGVGPAVLLCRRRLGK